MQQSGAALPPSVARTAHRKAAKIEQSCSNCPRRHICVVGVLDSSQLDILSSSIQRQRPVHAGKSIFSAGETYKGVFIVRSGFFKSCLINREGELQITGFHLPGEIFGVEGIGKGSYLHTVEALDTGSVCRIPASVLNSNEGENSRLVQWLVSQMSGIILRDSEMIFSLARMSAPRRLAVFLIDFFDRMQRSGFPRNDLMLGMSRTEMGNYLGLAEETVCRLFTRLQHSGIVSVNRRRIKSYDLDKLQRLATGVGLAKA